MPLVFPLTPFFLFQKATLHLVTRSYQSLLVCDSFSVCLFAFSHDLKQCWSKDECSVQCASAGVCPIFSSDHTEVMGLGRTSIELRSCVCLIWDTDGQCNITGKANGDFLIHTVLTVFFTGFVLFPLFSVLCSVALVFVTM